MERSENLNELATALAKAQGQIIDAKKDSANPFYKNKYADLASVWEACRKPLSDNGLSIAQGFEIINGKRYLETILLHSSGQSIRSYLDLTLKEETMQALGSAITYARRYSLSAIVGIVPDDEDDGNAASGIKSNVNHNVPIVKNPAPSTNTEVKQSPETKQEATERKDHWCPVHNVVFFKTEKMKAYAHPISDSGKWCSEPVEKGQKEM